MQEGLFSFWNFKTPKAKESKRSFQGEQCQAEIKKEGGCPKSTHDHDGNHLTLPKIEVKDTNLMAGKNHLWLGILENAF